MPLERLFDTPANWVCVMERKARRVAVAAERKSLPPASNARRPPSFPGGYFGVESLLVLLCLTASLLILPLVLPPLPPPPLLLLLLPVGILAVLMALAFMPSDVRNIASSYL